MAAEWTAARTVLRPHLDSHVREDCLALLPAANYYLRAQPARARYLAVLRVPLDKEWQACRKAPADDGAGINGSDGGASARASPGLRHTAAGLDSEATTAQHARYLAALSCARQSAGNWAPTRWRTRRTASRSRHRARRPRAPRVRRRRRPVRRVGARCSTPCTANSRRLHLREDRPAEGGGEGGALARPVAMLRARCTTRTASRRTRAGRAQPRHATPSTTRRRSTASCSPTRRRACWASCAICSARAARSSSAPGGWRSCAARRRTSMGCGPASRRRRRVLGRPHRHAGARGGARAGGSRRRAGRAGGGRGDERADGALHLYEPQSLQLAACERDPGEDKHAVARLLIEAGAVMADVVDGRRKLFVVPALLDWVARGRCNGTEAEHIANLTATVAPHLHRGRHAIWATDSPRRVRELREQLRKKLPGIAFGTYLGVHSNETCVFNPGYSTYYDSQAVVRQGGRGWRPTPRTRRAEAVPLEARQVSTRRAEGGAKFPPRWNLFHTSGLDRNRSSSHLHAAQARRKQPTENARCACSARTAGR